MTCPCNNSNDQTTGIIRSSSCSTFNESSSSSSLNNQQQTFIKRKSKYKTYFPEHNIDNKCDNHHYKNKWVNITRRN